MPFNIFEVLEKIKNEYDVDTDERRALSIIENRLYENKKLKKQLEIAVKALKRIMRDYEINGPCEEDCVGYYMFWDAKRAIQDCDTLEELDK